MTYPSTALSSLQSIYRPRRMAVAVNTREYEERLAPAIDYEALNDQIFNPRPSNSDRMRTAHHSSSRDTEPAA